MLYKCLLCKLYRANAFGGPLNFINGSLRGVFFGGASSGGSPRPCRRLESGSESPTVDRACARKWNLTAGFDR